MYVGKYTSPMDGKGTVFVWGHTIPSESRPKIRNRQQVVEKLVVAVDVDCSGTLSFPEYLFLMRLGESCRVGSSMQHWHALATSLGHVFLASFFSVFQESSWTWNTAVGGPDNSDKSIQKCISDTVSYLVVFWASMTYACHRKEEIQRLIRCGVNDKEESEQHKIIIQHPFPVSSFHVISFFQTCRVPQQL